MFCPKRLDITPCSVQYDLTDLNVDVPFLILPGHLLAHHLLQPVFNSLGLETVHKVFA